MEVCLFIIWMAELKMSCNYLYEVKNFDEEIYVIEFEINEEYFYITDWKAEDIKNDKHIGNESFDRAKEWVKNKWVIPSMKLEKDSLLHYPSIHDLFNSVKDPCSLLKLLQLGASPNTCDSRGNSLLVAASKADSFLCVKILIEFGADINQQDSFGTCALAAAVVYGEHGNLFFFKKCKIRHF